MCSPIFPSAARATVRFMTTSMFKIFRVREHYLIIIIIIIGLQVYLKSTPKFCRAESQKINNLKKRVNNLSKFI